MDKMDLEFKQKSIEEISLPHDSKIATEQVSSVTIGIAPALYYSTLLLVPTITYF